MGECSDGTGVMGCAADGAEVAAPRERRSLQGALLAVLLLVVLLTLRLLRGDPLVAARLDALAAPRFERVARTLDATSLTRGDPMPGFRLPASGAGHRIRAAAHGRTGPRVLVWIGDCADCMAADLPLWEREAARAGATMILLTSGSERAVSRLRTRKGLRSAVVGDPGGALARRLNAAWAGRPYLFSEDWRLLWVDRHVPGLRNPFAEAEVAQLVATERGVP